jgi:division protein CdvB (Snf7/Vps24/ESCRT-III family)
MVKVLKKKITLDDLAAMCMREFTAIREIMERTNVRMETMGARLDNISEIVLEDHKPRIRALEMQIFLDK